MRARTYRRHHWMTFEIGQNISAHRAAEANPTIGEGSPQGVGALTWLSMPTTNITLTTVIRQTISHCLLPWKGYTKWFVNFKTRIRNCQLKWKRWIRKMLGEKIRLVVIKIMVTSLEMRRRITLETLMEGMRRIRRPRHKVYNIFWAILRIHRVHSSLGQFQATHNIETIWWNWRPSSARDHV